MLVAGSLPFLAVVAWTVKSTNYGTEANVTSPKDWENALGGGTGDGVAASPETGKIPASAGLDEKIDAVDEKDSIKLDGKGREAV